VAVITGGARGIGAATGMHLATSGWRVAFIDVVGSKSPRFNRDALDYSLATAADLDSAVAAVERIAGAGSAVGLVADVCDQDALTHSVTEAVELFGRLDAAIAAAGTIAGGSPLWLTTDIEWQAMNDSNLRGVFHLIRAAVPYLIARPRPTGGRFVAVASAAALQGHERLGSYSAAKAAVVSLIRTLAVELGPKSVTANAVAPGSTRTAMLEASAAIYELSSVEDFSVHHPMGRLIEPSEVAAAIGWLCSPEASAVTGAVVPVDGGMTVS